MFQEPKYYLIEASALPEVFLKVAEAKRLLDTGAASTVGDAVKLVGISRSAFYKYRDHVLSFQSLMAGRILTFQISLYDQPGLLASVLNIFTQYGANILTINQSIPTNGCASISMTVDTKHLKGSLETMLGALKTTPGVIRAEVLAG